jgi:mono/diheme cytochrome c family protein
MKHVLKVLAAAGALAFAAGAQAEVTYDNAIKKIIGERCAGCHVKGSPTMEEFKKDEAGFKKKMKGPRMESYQDVMVLVNGSDTGAIMRRLDDGTGADGKKGNMYNYLGKNDADRAKNHAVFKEWVGGWTLKRKKDISEAELKAIKAPEK